MQYLNEQNIFLFLIQFFVLLGLARGLGEIFRRWKQPTLTAEILAGVILGPTILGRFLPEVYLLIFPQDVIQRNMLETVSWLGLLFFLLVIGLEVDFSSAWRQKGDALKIALTDIIVPLAISFIPWLFVPDYYLVHPGQRYVFSLFMATVMTITAMTVSARALHEMGVAKTDLGFLIISALSVNDIIGWLIFTLVLSIFTQINIEITRIFIIFISVIGFAILCLTLGRKFANFVIYRIKSEQMSEPATSLTFICLLGFLCGVLAQKIGIHALFGFFIAGIMVGGAKALSERTRQVISQMVYAIFIPLFFAGIGLKIDFLENFNIILILIVSVIGIFARFSGAWLGVNFTKQSKANRLSIAIAHTPGGTMEIVVGVLALQYHLITEPVFVAIVFGAVISSVILGPWLSYSLKKRKEIGVLEFFSKRAIIPNLKTTDRDRAILRLCELAAEQENYPGAEPFYSAVIQREEVMGTAMEEGVAVPHARIPALKKPIVVFGRSISGIDWNSPDGKLSQSIFLILTPQEDDEVQVQLLASIAKMMIDKQNRTEILEAQDLEGIWSVLHRALTTRVIRRK